MKRPAGPEKKNKGERVQRYPEFSTLQSLHREQSSAERRLCELEWIFKLNTKNIGLNRDVGFMEPYRFYKNENTPHTLLQRWNRTFVPGLMNQNHHSLTPP